MSVEFVAMVFIGGAFSVLGPLFGSIIITALPILLGAAPEGVETMVFGAINGSPCRKGWKPESEACWRGEMHERRFARRRP